MYQYTFVLLVLYANPFSSIPFLFLHVAVTIGSPMGGTKAVMVAWAPLSSDRKQVARLSGHAPKSYNTCMQNPVWMLPRRRLVVFCFVFILASFLPCFRFLNFVFSGYLFPPSLRSLVFYGGGGGGRFSVWFSLVLSRK